MRKYLSSRSWSAGCGESYLSGAGSAGRNSTAERQQGAVLRLHQASGAGESHTQEANVAEVSYGKPVMSNPSIQSNYRTTRRRASREESRLTRPINR